MILHINKARSFTAPLFRATSGTAKKIDLLWGDRVEVLSTSGSRAEVRARGMTGFVSKSRLQTSPLLELYFIDVGQGDGILIRTPDDRHILIDGGWPRKNQPTGKNAADFVDWKFVKDYGRDTIHIDAMICSHNDQDHYGGLWDLLGVDDENELDAHSVTVSHFYHAGLAWWKGKSGRTLGPSASSRYGPMWTRLLEDRNSIEGALKSGSGPKLQGEWADFLQAVRDTKDEEGNPTPIKRLSHKTATLDGFDKSNLRIHILAPVEFEVDGKPTIRKFPDGPDKNTNGNSILLRIDYKGARILLTGDLNLHSQQSLLCDYRGRTDEFSADVAKACHHGSDDISISFLKKIEPACTIISSGDSEGHDHPKPEVIAASGLTGKVAVEDDKLVTPLIYSTELARSVDLGRITKVVERSATEPHDIIKVHKEKMLGNLEAFHRVVDAGARNAKRGSSPLSNRRLATKTTYGLINVRTDGKTILCAALNEKEFKWNISTFQARFR